MPKSRTVQSGLSRNKKKEVEEGSNAYGARSRIPADNFLFEDKLGELKEVTIDRDQEM
jgi:hypothetical protein